MIEDCMFHPYLQSKYWPEKKLSWPTAYLQSLDLMVNGDVIFFTHNMTAKRNELTSFKVQNVNVLFNTSYRLVKDITQYPSLLKKLNKVSSLLTTHTV